MQADQEITLYGNPSCCRLGLTRLTYLQADQEITSYGNPCDEDWEPRGAASAYGLLKTTPRQCFTFPGPSLDSCVAVDPARAATLQLASVPVLDGRSVAFPGDAEVTDVGRKGKAKQIDDRKLPVHVSTEDDELDMAYIDYKLADCHDCDSDDVREVEEMTDRIRWCAPSTLCGYRARGHRARCLAFAPSTLRATVAHR